MSRVIVIGIIYVTGRRDILALMKDRVGTSMLMMVKVMVELITLRSMVVDVLTGAGLWCSCTHWIELFMVVFSFNTIVVTMRGLMLGIGTLNILVGQLVVSWQACSCTIYYIVSII